MGEIFLPGFPFSISIEGDAPNKQEAQEILKLVEKLDQVKMTGGEDILDLAEKYRGKGSEFGASILEGAVDAEEKKNALKILDDLGMINLQDLKPLEQIGLDRTTAGVAGSVFASAGGYKDLYDQLRKNVSGGKIPTPNNILLAGGKAYFGGVFGDIGGRVAYDIANAIISGDPNMLEFLKEGTLDADAQQAMWYESLGLVFPQLIGAGFKALTNISDPAVKAALDSAERLGIQINFGQIAKYADRVKAIGPLPFIGGGVRKYLESQGKKLSNSFQKITELYVPLRPFTEISKDIFARATPRFEAGKRILNSLWTKAYDAHAMLPNKNVFRGNAINDFVKKLTNGDIIRQLKGIPVNEEGIIKEYDTIVKEGFFDRTALSRLKGDKLKDLITSIRNQQLNIKEQGGNLSYTQIKDFNDSISTLFKDLTEGGEAVFGDRFSKLLTQLRYANEGILTNMDKTLIKELIPEDMLPAILSTNSAALNYTKVLAQLYEGASANIFGKYVDNIFEPGYKTEKKNIDEFLKSLLAIKSPQGLRDLRKLVGDKEFKNFANEYLSDVFTKSLSKEAESTLFGLGVKKGLFTFDPAELNKRLGFDIRGKSDFTDELFKILGVGNSKLQDIIRAGAFIENVKIGDPSTFLQRRFQLAGANNLFATLLGAGAAYKGGTMAFDEDDGIFTKGFKGILGLMVMKYGVNKVFANPKLGKQILDVYGLEPRVMPFRNKLDVMKSIFEIHHNEQPEEIVNDVNMFSKVVEDLSDVVSEKELNMMNDLLNDLKNKADIFNKSQTLEEEEQEMEDLRNRVYIPDDQTEVNVPSPNESIEMADVVAPLPNPNTGSASMDPNIMQRLEGVGLTLFAREGGIASLTAAKKPQPMVA